MSSELRRTWTGVSTEHTSFLTTDRPLSTKLSQTDWRAQCFRELGRDGIGLEVLRVRGLNADGRAFEGVLHDLRVRRRPALDLRPRDTQVGREREAQALGQEGRARESACQQQAKGTRRTDSAVAVSSSYESLDGLSTSRGQLV